MAQSGTHKYFCDKNIRSLFFAAKGVTKAPISLYTREVTGSSPVSTTGINVCSLITYCGFIFTALALFSDFVAVL